MALVKLVANFNRDQVRRQLQEFNQRLEQNILLTLTRIGERFVTNCRNLDTYKDRTKNLRSSISYCILKDGVQLVDGFGTGIGAEKSKSIVSVVAGDFPNGFLLIGVAGMEYAAAVESKGYDVITGSCQIAETELKRAILEIKQEIDEL